MAPMRGITVRVTSILDWCLDFANFRNFLRVGCFDWNWFPNCSSFIFLIFSLADLIQTDFNNKQAETNQTSVNSQGVRYPILRFRSSRFFFNIVHSLSSNQYFSNDFKKVGITERVSPSPREINCPGSAETISKNREIDLSGICKRKMCFLFGFSQFCDCQYLSLKFPLPSLSKSKRQSRTIWGEWSNGYKCLGIYSR